MPGKHAPASSKSFLVSLGTAVGGAVAALAVVVGIALVALNAGSEKPSAAPTVRPPTTAPPATTPPSTPPATESPTTEPATEAKPVGQTTLRVLNGSGRDGVARQMAGRAKEEGYPEPKVGNTTRTAKSTVFYAEGNRAEAEEFQRRFPEFTEIAEAPSAFEKDVMLTIVIGLDYPSDSTASPSPTT